MDKAAINVIGLKNCCSCGLCQSTCPFNAITMVLDAQGFYKPQIDEKACTNCGACSRTCPIIKTDCSNSQFEHPQFIGCWSKDKNNVRDSSSGGIAYELGRAFIEKGGCVCGVMWKNGIPTYEIATTIRMIEHFRGSKYLQADTSDIYKKIKSEIKDGKKVLFFGLPCQIQAIKNYITSDCLFCVDLVCAGVPSMLMYKKYCTETFGDKIISYVNFRAKEKGKPAPWRRYSLEFYSKEYLLKRESHGNNPFFLAFNSTKTYNRACYSCKFNTIPRRGDITLCDFWGAPSDKENVMGTSLIIVNNSNGQNLISTYLTKKPMPISTINASREEALEGTRRINLSVRDIPVNYDQIFATLHNRGFYTMYKRYINPSIFKRIFMRLGLFVTK